MQQPCTSRNSCANVCTRISLTAGSAFPKLFEPAFLLEPSRTFFSLLEPSRITSPGRTPPFLRRRPPNRAAVLIRVESSMPAAPSRADPVRSESSTMVRTARPPLGPSGLGGCHRAAARSDTPRRQGNQGRGHLVVPRRRPPPPSPAAVPRRRALRPGAGAARTRESLACTRRAVM